MENIIFNELIVRGFSVDVGVVYSNEKNSSGSYSKTAREIDFIASKGNRKVYIQSAFALPDEAKTEQELKPFFSQMILFRRSLSAEISANGGITITVS